LALSAIRKGVARMSGRLIDLGLLRLWPGYRLAWMRELSGDEL
jgi:hypothetical protein